MTLTVVLSLLWLVVLWRLPALWQSRQQRLITMLLMFVAASATLMHPAVRRTTDAGIGVPDLSILLSHLVGLLVIITAVQFTSAVTGASRPRRTPLRHSKAVAAVVAVCMVALFIAVPRRFDRPDFGVWQGGDIRVVAYMLLFHVSLGVGLCLALSFLVRHWRSASRGPLRTALLLLWLAVAVAIPYVVNRVWATLRQGFGADPIADPVYHMVFSLTEQVFLLLGALSALVPLTGRLGALIRRHVAYHRLRDLWTTLTNAVPGTVLSPPPHPLSVLAFRTMELLLYRRAVEIRDAQLELIHKVPRAIRDTAEAELSRHGFDHELALDACTLRIALGIKDRAPATSPCALHWTTATGLDDEIAALLTLSNLMRDTTICGIATHATVGHC
ncbi:MAB_1171c family putative transporter [Actinocrispum wychmicini]|uniref:DUF6545 domain-containing protein n=1 Tax=Actinocrispum wychmicini TaxID=1213861 RepID=A0A4R2JPZ0_9PSEU|nr:MAB_1171c family putative transporter [Actinocrispum wychmicini]TCO62263.1 hypothetical protein EV192_102400 [Actinocrispum wychmicini]